MKRLPLWVTRLLPLWGNLADICSLARTYISELSCSKGKGTWAFMWLLLPWLLVEGCGWRLLMLCCFWPAKQAAKQAPVVRESPQAEKGRCWHLTMRLKSLAWQGKARGSGQATGCCLICHRLLTALEIGISSPMGIPLRS